MSDGHDEPINRIAVSSHRLPTVSASQALRQSTPTTSPRVPFGLKELDSFIAGNESRSTGEHGLRRGSVAELYGPPGIGKTALCMSAAASVLKRDGKVTWIDTKSPPPALRLRNMLAEHDHDADQTETNEITGAGINERLSHFEHYSVPTLAHLLALLLHTPPSFAPTGTELVVVESLATLIDITYPRMNDRPNARKGDSKSSSDRRRSVVADLANSLSRIAAVKNLVVIITNNMVTQIRAQTALLKPAIATMEYDNTISTRIALFHDWAQRSNGDEHSRKKHLQGARFAKVQKVAGTKPAVNRTDTLFAFDIGAKGVQELSDITTAYLATDLESGLPVLPTKRGIDEVEAAESDEEYGWTEDDIQVATEGLVEERFLTARDVKDTEQVVQQSEQNAGTADNAIDQD